MAARGGGGGRGGEIAEAGSLQGRVGGGEERGRWVWADGVVYQSGPKGGMATSVGQSLLTALWWMPLQQYQGSNSNKHKALLPSRKGGRGGSRTV